MAGAPRKKRGAAKLDRHVGTKTPKKRIVVVCEGEKTEPMYLKLVNACSEGALVELVVVDEPASSPKQLVERACSEKKSAARKAKRTKDPNSEIDEIWCAFDVDEHPLIKEASQQASDNGVHLAISNPSIEVWFLLHFIDQRGYIDRHEALKQLKTHIKGYDKRVTTLDDLKDLFDDARERAQMLDTKHAKDQTDFPNNNPSSDMWKLVESMKAKY